MRHKETGKRFTREDHLKRFKEVFGEEPPFDIKYMTAQQFSEFAQAHKEHVFRYMNEHVRQNVGRTGQLTMRRAACCHMVQIKNIKFSFLDAKYDIEAIDIQPVVNVVQPDYENVLQTIQKLHPDYRDIRIISYTK